MSLTVDQSSDMAAVSEEGDAGSFVAFGAMANDAYDVAALGSGEDR